MESSYVHDDIIYQILLRTSNEALARFRLASKKWNQTTYDSEFKKARSQKTNIVDGFFIQELINSQSQYVTSFASFVDETRKISLGFIPRFDVRVIAVSENSGIILCKSHNFFRQYQGPRFFVCKPQVGLCKRIPNPRKKLFEQEVAMSVICSNPLRYKILRISSTRTFTTVNNCHKLILEVFDSKAWRWKRLKDILLPYRAWFSMEMPVVAACGAFHWLLIGGFILSFDIEKEECKIIPLPVVKDDYRRIYTAKYEGKLALMCMDIEWCLHTWVLESYVNMIWKKRFVINMKVRGSRYLAYTPLAFYSSDIIVVCGYWSSLMYYDFKNDKFLKESKPEKEFFPREIFPFWWDSEPRCLSNKVNVGAEE